MRVKSVEEELSGSSPGLISGADHAEEQHHLQLDKGATLLGSSDHGDYPARMEFRAPGLQPLVSAANVSHVAITGEGVIDGAGQT
jgi:hypothetical protein